MVSALSGLDEFLVLVRDVPNIDDETSDTGDPLYFDAFGRPTVYGSRLRFLAGYAQFHNWVQQGEKREAAQTLVRMLNTEVVPKSWWGVVLLDAAHMCQGQSQCDLWRSVS